MNKKIITLTATVALLVGGGAGYFSGAAVESKAGTEAVKAVQNEKIVELSKAHGKYVQDANAIQAAADTRQKLCAEYVEQSEKVIASLTDTLDISTKMLTTPNDFSITARYSQAADEFSETYIIDKLTLEGLATSCEGIEQS